jgi:dolichol-phosphate mannosyltransferase
MGVGPVAQELVCTATYCERDNIERWVRGVVEHRPDADLLVVDDNSPDGTGEILRRLAEEFSNLHVHSRAGKEGLNTAHLFALKTALEGGYDRAVTMDADGSHQPSQIGRLVDASRDADFVIGTRYQGGTHQAPPFRRFLSRGANMSARLLLPMSISEYTTSFRVFNPTAMATVAEAAFDFRGYAFFIECLEVIHRAGLTMAEVPIDFLDREGGTSKIPRAQILLSMEALAQLSWRRRRRRVQGR